MSIPQFLCAKYAGQTSRIDPRALYSADHLWARRAGALATVGVSDYVRLRMGEGHIVEQRPVVLVLKRGAEIAQWDAIKALVSLLCPIGGTIVELNPALRSRPGLACEDPYDQGWMATLIPTDWEEDAARLWNAAQYLDALRDEIELETQRTTPPTETKS